MKIKALFIFLFIPVFSAFGQVFDGTFLKWELPKNTDSRVGVKFGSTGINIGGYEGTTVVINNLTAGEIYIEVKLIIRDFCGNETVRSIKTKIDPNGKIGGSTWMGGSEQFDYSTACKERKKYGDNFYTRIRNAELSIEKLTSKGNPSDETDKPADKGDATSYYNDAGKRRTITDTSNQDFWGTTLVCPEQGISVANTAGMNCIQLRWMSKETIQFNDKTNELKIGNSPDNFVLEYKKDDDLTWREIKISGYQLTYNLAGLDPCTKYEVRIKRDCGNDNHSAYSDNVIFNTSCPAPMAVKAKNIGQNEATIGSMFPPVINICANTKPSHTIEIEYCTPGVNWQTVYTTPGAGGSILYNLNPNTTYRARVRYRYGKQLVSAYSNEIVFTTLK
jgi:hypothetical protein